MIEAEGQRNRTASATDDLHRSWLAVEGTLTAFGTSFDGTGSETLRCMYVLITSNVYWYIERIGFCPVPGKKNDWYVDVCLCAAIYEQRLDWRTS
jgi:hypothetical protein